MLVKKEQELGRRKSLRVNFERSAFIILVPDAPWIECSIIDISETGVCLKVGALTVPKVFGLALNPSGTVRRVCLTAWRFGETIGAQFVTAKELRTMAPQLQAARSEA
jgi:PilZ domain